MSVANCIDCQLPFVADESWKRRCVGCWKKEKEWDLTVGDKAFLAMQEKYVLLLGALEQMEAHMAAMSGRIEELERAQRPSVGITLNDRQIKKLLSLCHPDKHRGSKTSHEVTRWLLRQRERL